MLLRAQAGHSARLARGRGLEGVGDRPQVPRRERGNLELLAPGRRALTDLGEPPGYAAVHLIQEDDDHQVDDDRSGRDRDPDVGPHGWGGVHGQGSGRGDSVDDDAKDDGEGHRYLQRGGCLGWATWVSPDHPFGSSSPAPPPLASKQGDLLLSPTARQGSVALTS